MISQTQTPEMIDDYPSEVIETVLKHDMIGAIKKLRAARNLDLHSAKDQVEKLQAKLRASGRLKNNSVSPIIVLGWVVAALVLALFIFNDNGPVPLVKPADRPAAVATSRVTFTPQMKESVDHLFANGFARVDVQLHKVWLSPELWFAADAATKEEMAATFAIYFAEQNKKDLYYCEVLDKQSAKKLGSYSQSGGFKVVQ